MANESATFNIELEGNAAEVSGLLSEKIDRLRQNIQGSTERIGAMSKSLKALRGDTQEVVDAKAALSAKLGVERDKVSAANLELVKHGAVLTNLKKPQQDAAKGTDANTKAQDKFGRALGVIGGPVDDIIGKFGSLKTVLGGAESGFSAVALVVAGTVAAVVALGTALVSGFIALGKWIAVTGDAGRNAALLREAFAGSAENGARLGTQVDALARKVPLAKDKLNELGTQLLRTRLNGQQIVDTLNIVGQASGAMGDEIGKGLGDLVKRGQLSKRFQINPQELVGTGIQFNDVAKNLSKNLNIGIDKAKEALFLGTVKLDDGAKALRQTVEARFGELNAKKLISLDAITQSLHDRFTALTRNVDMTRILKPISEMAMFFDESTVSGSVLQSTITSIGKILGDTLTDSVTPAKKLFLILEIGFLDVLIGAIKLKRGLDPFVDNLVTAAGWVSKITSEFFKLQAFVAGPMVTALAPLNSALGKVAELAGIGGASAPPGGGFEGNTRTGPGFGAVTVAPANALGGLVTPAPGEAFASVAPGEHIVPAGASVGGGKASISVNFNIQATGAHGKEIADELGKASFLSTLTKALEEAATSAGIPIQTPGAP